MSDRRVFIKSGAAALGMLAVSPGRVLGRLQHARSHPQYGAAESEAPRALKILILGGTSFLGPHQVHLALERGHSVTLFNRGHTVPRMFVQDFDHVRHLVGDREGDLSALAGSRWDVVIDNSTRRTSWAEATVDLLRDSAEYYVFVSSTGVYYPYAETDLAETASVLMQDTRSGQDGSMVYGVMKASAEEVVRRRFGDRAIVVRPGHIVGPGDTQPNRFPYWTTRLERGGEVLAPGKKSDPTQLVDVRDLIGFMFHLFESGLGGTFNVVGPATPLSMEQFLYGVRACTSAPVSWVWVEDHAWLAENGLVAAIPWVLPQGDERGHMAVDASRALAAGLTLRPLANTVFDVMEWWHSDAVPSQVRENVRFPLTPEREQELIAAWKARG